MRHVNLKVLLKQKLYVHSVDQDSEKTQAQINALVVEELIALNAVKVNV